MIKSEDGSVQEARFWNRDIRRNYAIGGMYTVHHGCVLSMSQPVRVRDSIRDNSCHLWLYRKDVIRRQRILTRGHYSRMV